MGYVTPGLFEKELVRQTTGVEGFLIIQINE